MALLATNATTPGTVTSALTGTSTLSPSPLPIVIQKRLAYAAKMRRESETDDGEESQVDEDDDDDESVNSEDMSYIKALEEGSISESVTVINEEKLAKRLSSRTQSLNSTSSGLDNGNKVLEQLERMDDDNDDDLDETSVDLLSSPVTAAHDFPCPSSNGSDMSKTVSNEDNVENLSKTMTTSQTQSHVNYSHHTSYSTPQHLFPPFYAGSKAKATSTIDKHGKTDDHATKAQQSGKLTDRLCNLTGKIEDNHMSRRYLPTESDSTPTSSDNVSPSCSAAHVNSRESSGEKRNNFTRVDSNTTRNFEHTQLRMESIGLTMDLEEKSRELLALKATLDEVKQSELEWKLRAKDLERKNVSEVAKVAALLKKNEELVGQISDIKLASTSELREKEAQNSK